MYLTPYIFCAVPREKAEDCPCNFQTFCRNPISYSYTFCIWTPTYLWRPICQSQGFDTWEAPRSPHYRVPASPPSWTPVLSQTSCTSCTSYWTPSGWLSSETCFAAQSSRLACCSLRTWIIWQFYNIIFLCWNPFCQDFNPDMSWCDSFGFHWIPFDYMGFHLPAVLDHFGYICVLLASIWQLSMTSMFQLDLTWLCREGSSIPFLTFLQNEY